MMQTIRTGKMRVAIGGIVARRLAGRGLAGPFAADRRGTAVIEFALVAAPLIALLIAVLQMALLFLVQQNLETAAQRAVRKLITGTAQSTGMTQAQFKNQVCSTLPAFMKCANVMVDVQVAASFPSANVSSPTISYDASGNPNNAWIYQPGSANQITIAKIMYIWGTSKGPLGFNLSNMTSGNRLLIATSVFKVEPYL